MGILDPSEWAALDDEVQGFWIAWYNQMVTEG